MKTKFMRRKQFDNKELEDEICIGTDIPISLHKKLSHEIIDRGITKKQAIYEALWAWIEKTEKSKED